MSAALTQAAALLRLYLSTLPALSQQCAAECSQVVWGWIIAALLALLIALSMAEISSGLPSAGGPFFWAS